MVRIGNLKVLEEVEIVIVENGSTDEGDVIGMLASAQSSDELAPLENL